MIIFLFDLITMQCFIFLLKIKLEIDSVMNCVWQYILESLML